MNSSVSVAPSNSLLKIALADNYQFDHNPEANVDFDLTKYEKLRLTTEQFLFYKTHGWIKIPKLFNTEEIKEFNDHMDAIQAGTVEIPGLNLDSSMTKEQRTKAFSRIQMLHKRHPLHEKYLLHPRLLDVIEQLEGPDVLALQTISFFKEPGQPGQGWHQDSGLIPTTPPTLIASWVALTPATEANGCLRLADGSNLGPIYPNAGYPEFTHQNAALEDIRPIYHHSVLEEEKNDLTPAAKKYEEVIAAIDPGDALFFHGNLLHRSLANTSKTSSRRAFTSHYCNARSLCPWNDGSPIPLENANLQFILARGDSHIPAGKPKFGMPLKLERTQAYRG